MQNSQVWAVLVLDRHQVDTRTERRLRAPRTRVLTTLCNYVWIRVLADALLLFSGWLLWRRRRTVCSPPRKTMAWPRQRARPSSPARIPAWKREPTSSTAIGSATRRRYVRSELPSREAATSSVRAWTSDAAQRAVNRFAVRTVVIGVGRERVPYPSL